MLCKSKLYLLTLLTLLSTVSLNAAVNTQYSETLCKPGTYLFGCQQLTGSGDYDETMPRLGAAGDSTVTVHLLFASQKDVAYNATIEPGQIYLFGCQQLTADATETETLQQVGCACDSTVTLHLSVQASTDVTVSYEETITLGETYLFGCTPMKPTAVGDVTDQITLPRIGVAGDSIINLTLHVQAVPDITVSYEETITLGETYLFGCTPMKPTAVGDVTDQITLPRLGAAGDSIINLTLHVQAVPDVTVTYDETIMVDEYYLFGCQAYKFSESGPQQLTQTLPRVGAAGDSIIICNLTVAGAGGVVVVSYEETITLGETYLFGCNPIKPTVAGDVTDQITLPRVGTTGDSIINLTLHVQNAPITVAYEETITLGETYLFGCHLMKPTAVKDTTEQLILPRVGTSGDSIINLTLHVQQACVTTYGTEPDPGPQCDVYYWAFAGDSAIYTSGTYTHVGTNVGGCDSIVTLTVEILQSTTGDTTATNCGTFIWYENTCAATGTYYHTFPNGNAAGCDSTVTLTFTLLEPTTGDTTASNCGTFIWYENTCASTGDYTHVFTNAAGCDSTVTLHFTLLEPTVGDTTASNCGTFIWYENTCASTGDYVHTFIGGNAAGCDSVVTLHFTLLSPSTGDTTAVECDQFIWYEYTCTASGDYVHTFIGGNAVGCDSVVTLHLTLNKSTVGDTTAVECDQFVWYEHTCTTSGDYTHVFTNAAGCDSTVTLHLTINNSVTKTVNVGKKCNMYYWAEADTTIIDGGINSYTHVFQTYQNCDSIVTLTVEIDVPYETTLDIKGYYGDRIIMINRNQINEIPGWHLDSLDTEHPELVEWYRIEASGDTTFLGTGYYYTLPSGDPLPAGVYFAEINLPAVGESCGAIGKTILYTITASAGAPALMPSYAQPGEDIRVVNLDPMEETIIRVYTAEGALQATYKAHGETTYPIKAAFEQGFYIVELSNSSMKSTLRYIVK